MFHCCWIDDTDLTEYFDIINIYELIINLYINHRKTTTCQLPVSVF